MRTRYNKRIDRANRTRSALARKGRGRLRLSIFRSSKQQIRLRPNRKN